MAKKRILRFQVDKKGFLSNAIHSGMGRSRIHRCEKGVYPENKLFATVRRYLRNEGVDTYPQPLNAFLIEPDQMAQRFGAHTYGVTVMRSDGVSSSRSIEYIAVRGGLSPAQTSAIFAHEMGHVCLHHSGVNPEIEPLLEEGACEVFAYRWLLRWFRGEWDEQLTQMFRNETPVYGDGFRQLEALSAGRSLKWLVQALAQGSQPTGRLSEWPGKNAGSRCDV